MIRVINFYIYGRAIPNKLLLCNVGLFRDPVYFCKSYSYNTRSTYRKNLWDITVLCVSQKLMLSSTYYIALLTCLLFFHEELIHRLNTIPVSAGNFYRPSIAFCITAPDSIAYLYILYIVRLSIWKCY